MKKIAIVVATQYGQTTKIAERIAAVLRGRGHSVRTFTLIKRKDIERFDEFDAVVVGGPVYAGKFPGPLMKWTKKHADQLQQKPTAFFSVSLNAADKRPAARKEDIRLISKFLDETGLKAKVTASLIGALHYRKYNFLIRWLLRRISKSANGPTDTSRDHELTDWLAVEAFAGEIGKMVAPDAEEVRLIERVN